MKYLKILGLAAIAAAAMMAFAGSASATELTCSAGTMCTPAPTPIHAAVEGTVILHPPIGDIECSEGTVSGRASTGSATETVKSVNAKGEAAEIEALTFGKCNAEVVVIKKGSLEIHTQETAANNNGTLTSTGAEVTVTFAGFHCIFETKATDIGLLTGSSNVVPAGSTATLDITATIPRTGGRSGAFCGSSAKWTGSYKVDTPDFLNVD